MSDWNDLNTLTAPGGRRTGDYGVHHPVNAWPGAASDIVVWLHYVGDNLVQHGHDVGNNEQIWQRQRKDGSADWTQWTLQSSAPEPPPGGVIISLAHYDDGTEPVVLPDFTKLNCRDISGTAATIEAGDLRIAQPGRAVIEIRTKILHSAGSHVIFGYAWNGAAPQELSRVQVNSTEPTLVLAHFDTTLTANDLLSIYLSSDLEWQEFAWSDTELIIVFP
jgi:hypothetical protein